jgi:photosystem II stability/assembly factor-like uncharacterized protein
MLFASAQKTSIFNIPNNIPRPCWVDKVNWNKPNLFEIRETMKACMEGSSETRGNIEKELEEEPYEIAFRRWLHGPNIFIQHNGDIFVNDDSAQKIFDRFVGDQGKYKASKQSFSPITNGPAVPTGVANWTALGPLATYENGEKKSWQANIYCIAIAPKDPAILYCGSETGILFKSTDKGLNWFSVSDALARSAPSAIAIDPSNANIVYASMGGTNMVKTTDGGSNWTGLTFPGGSSNEIVINATTGRILTASASGIYYSDNGGSNWTKATTSIAPGTEIYDIALNPSDPSIVYAVTAINTSTTDDMVVFVSTNGGQSFTAASLPSSTYSTGARLAVSAANSSYVYCITLQNDVPKLLVSTDNGSTWSTRTTFTGTGLVGSASNNGMSNGQGYYDLDIMVSPLNVNHVIVGTTSAYKSTDGGLNFSPLGGYNGSFPLHPDVQCMAAKGSDAFITTDGGVNYSSDFFTNLSSFEPRNIGLTASDHWGFGQGWSEDIVVGGRYHNGNAALYESYGAGNSLRLGGGEDATGHVFQIPGETAITGFRDLGNALKKLPPSTNGSRSDAQFVNTKWPSDDYYGAFSSKLMQDPRYANIFYVGNGNSLWKSENYGLSYTELKNFNAAVWRFDIARSNPSVLYLCATNGIYKTNDGGSTWSQLLMPSGVTYQYYNTDIAVNPANENEVWFCMANGASSNKVFKSTNGGSTWSNYTGTLLNGKSVAYLAMQGGTNSGIYAITNSDPSKVYYRDASMSDWINYSNNLPNNFNARSGGIIFHRDNKLRITGNRGTWESPLYSLSTPLAMPIANKKFISCARDTVLFKDHSILDYSGATWNWSFPGASYVSSTSAKEVKVTYPAPGNYSVTLTVTDTRGNSNTRTVTNMIVFTSDNCAVDSVPGKSLRLNFDGRYYSIGTANINSNNFTISCWFRPQGFQKSFAQLIAHDPYPGSSYGFGLGFTFSGYTPNLRLCYTDNVVGYGNSTNAIADSTKWNHVALVYSPTGVIIYLNGVPYSARSATMAALDLSQTPFYINKDIHNQGGDYKGEIDEIKIYNYALTQNEVREKMHLIQNEGIAETGLIKYVQFNSMDAQSNNVYELVNGTAVTIPGNNVLLSSGAPVGKGISFRKSITAGGMHSFTGTGVNLYFSSNTGTVYPNGELVVSRLTPLPSFLPDSANALHLDKYYIINNYGTNASFTALDSIQLSSVNLIDGYTAPSNYSLYKRPSFAYDRQTWGSALGTATYLSGTSNGNGQLRFSGSSVNSFSQFVVAAPRICGMKSSVINAVASSLCAGSGTDLSLSEGYDKNSYSFAWYSAATSNGTYVQVGKDSAGLSTGVLNSTTYYKCTISCKSAAANLFTTPVITVQVTSPFTFNSQPSTTATTYCQGSNASALSVSVSGGSVEKYEWYRNTISSSTGGTLVTTNTSSSLSNSYTPSTASNGTFYYYAVVYAPGGCSTRSNVSGAITVSTGPVIVAQPSSSNVSYCSGVPATPLSVTATISTGSLSYQWYSNTVNTTSGGTSIRGATSSIYTPPTGTTGTRYYYVIVNPTATCRATSSVSGSITVNATPATPNSISVSGGSSKSGVLSSCPVISPTQTTYTYTSSTVTNAVSYQWALPACATGTATASINSIAVKFTGIKSTDSIKVRSRNSAGCYSPYRAVKATNGTNCTPLCTLAAVNNAEPSAAPAPVENGEFFVELYPNPSQNDFNLSVQSSGHDKIIVTVSDLQGRILKKLETVTDASFRFGAELHPGIFIVKIEQGKTFAFRKMIKY